MSKYGFNTLASEIVADLPRRVAGKKFVITGASASSLRGNTALYLAAGKPSAIILLARTASKVEPVIKEIASISIMAVPHETSKEGIESQFGVNHIGHFLVTNLLLPKIANGGRIVNVASNGHALGGVRFDDHNFQDGKVYDEWEAYGQSKTADVAFSLQPGVASTSLSGHLDPATTNWTGIMKRISSRGVRAVQEFKSIDEACATIVAAAVDPSLEEFSGAYLDDCNPTPATPEATGDENAERLWKLSQELVGEKFTY
ncbi:hypothetical protein B7463_g5554, partial [Scytalidium lignicola]